MIVVTIPADKSILIVEDNEERLKWFREKLAGMEFTICTTPEAALEVLSVYRFNIVFLDHDCVPRFVDPSEIDFESLTFWRVAQRLAVNFDGNVIIHSGNPIGAKRMEKLLQDRSNARVTVAPFGNFDIVKTCVRD